MRVEAWRAPGQQEDENPGREPRASRLPKKPSMEGVQKAGLLSAFRCFWEAARRRMTNWAGYGIWQLWLNLLWEEISCPLVEAEMLWPVSKDCWGTGCGGYMVQGLKTQMPALDTSSLRGPVSAKSVYLSVFVHVWVCDCVRVYRGGYSESKHPALF